ncbi:uncharacterized protein LOC121233700 [Aquila chrysaetos chrysaetos]|uniref:uncharacterized protein LOC121233700 n=1 Tax=Aquila chrysaetos chrysaetos TaxID=223781 RepID=UPI001B7D2D20|nr:uncharacterized protein LOC121233700 [Aquila chrysaetos chrysaetos]
MKEIALCSRGTSGRQISAAEQPRSSTLRHLHRPLRLGPGSAAAVLQPGRVAGEAVNSRLPRSKPRAGFSSSARGSPRLLWERRARPPALRLLSVWVWGFSFPFLSFFLLLLSRRTLGGPREPRAVAVQRLREPVLGQGQCLGRVSVRGEMLSGGGTGSCAVPTPTGLRPPGVRSGSRRPSGTPGTARRRGSAPPDPPCWGPPDGDLTLHLLQGRPGKVCPCPRGCVLLSAWGRVRESCRDLSVLASPPKGCFPWGRGQGSRSRSRSRPPPPSPAPLVVTRAWGWLGSPRGSPARMWGSAGLLHLLGAVSRCPPRSLPVPHRHGAVLGKELLIEKTKEKVPPKLL